MGPEYEYRECPSESQKPAIKPNTPPTKPKSILSKGQATELDISQPIMPTTGPTSRTEAVLIHAGLGKKARDT
jgi:hypothetical protein